MKAFFNWIISLFSLTNDTKCSEQPVKKRRVTKKPDTTKFTQHHYDFIQDSYSAWQEYNKGLSRKDRVPMDALCREINNTLGMNKSQRTLSRVWSGEIDRDELAVGKPINPDSEDTNLAMA